MPEYLIKTGSAAMQPERIHGWLSEHSYWAKGIPFETVQTVIANSFCIGVFADDIQVGFARFVTDYAVFAYLADVYVEEAHRGRGLSKRLMDALMAQPFVAGLRGLKLGTLDAHGLYAQYGFKPLAHPERSMEIVHFNTYQQHEPADRLS